MRWREPMVFVVCVAACGRRESGRRGRGAAEACVRAAERQVKHVTTDVNRALDLVEQADGLQAAAKLRRARATDGSRHDRGEQAQGLERRDPDGAARARLALATGATDLANVSSASRAHNAKKTRSRDARPDQGSRRRSGRPARGSRRPSASRRSSQSASDARSAVTARSQRAVASFAAVRSGTSARSDSSSGGP